MTRGLKPSWLIWPEPGVPTRGKRADEAVSCRASAAVVWLCEQPAGQRLRYIGKARPRNSLRGMGLRAHPAEIASPVSRCGLRMGACAGPSDVYNSMRGDR
jgi:hypothetical protein